MSHLLIVIVAAIVLLTPVVVWIGFLMWAAIGDGRDQREHDKLK